MSIHHKHLKSSKLEISWSATNEQTANKDTIKIPQYAATVRRGVDFRIVVVLFDNSNDNWSFQDALCFLPLRICISTSPWSTPLLIRLIANVSKIDLRCKSSWCPHASYVNVKYPSLDNSRSIMFTTLDLPEPQLPSIPRIRGIIVLSRFFDVALATAPSSCNLI